MSVFEKVRQKAANAAYRVVGLTARLAFHLVPARHAHALMKFLSFGPSIRLVDPIWRPMLLANHYRFLAADWVAYYERRVKTAPAMVRRVQMLIDTKQFDKAKELIPLAKDRVYARRVQEKQFMRVVDQEMIIELEEHGLTPRLEAAIIGRSSIGEYFYRRAWEAHTMLNGKRVLDCVRIYFLAVRFKPEVVAYCCDVLLKPNEQWNAIVQFVDKAREIHGRMPIEDPTFKKRREQRAVQNELLALKLLGLVNAARFTEAAAMIPAEPPQEMLPSIAAYHAALGQQEEATRVSSDALYILQENWTPAIRDKLGELVCALGVMMEEAREFDAARALYRRAYDIGGIKFYIPEPVYRYFSMMMANGEWDEAILVLRRAHLILWRSFAKLAKEPPAERIERGEYIPKAGALFLGGWGIGDEIMRLSILREARAPGGKYAYLCDPRFKAMFTRAMPDVEFFSNSRIFGPFRVSEEEYWRDREGAPIDSDLARVSELVMKKKEGYPDVALSEDLFYHFVAQKGAYRGSAKPLLTAMPDKVEAARKWLATLPSGVNIGISWRSGTRDIYRNKAYTEITNWGEIFAIPGLNFILLQYSDVSEELKEVEAKYGVKMHAMPGVDLKDDQEDIAGLCMACDIVLTPGTALRELAGALGARTWSLSTTPYYPDLWRIDPEDSVTDVLFPSIHHFTAMRHGSREAVLTAIAEELKTWRTQASAA